MRLEKLKGRTSQNLGKIVLSVALVTGTATGAYLLGNYNGLNEGKRIGRNEFITEIYTENLNRQSEDLKKSSSDFFELLEYFQRSRDTYKYTSSNKNKI